MKTLFRVLAGTVIVLVLLTVTLRTTSTPLEKNSHDLATATSECQRSIRERVADARFPFQPTVDTSVSGRLILSGSIDSGGGQDRERRNYVCYLGHDAMRETYVTDSVEVWKSH